MGKTRARGHHKTRPNRFCKADGSIDLFTKCAVLHYNNRYYPCFNKEAAQALYSRLIKKHNLRDEDDDDAFNISEHDYIMIQKTQNPGIGTVSMLKQTAKLLVGELEKNKSIPAEQKAEAIAKAKELAEV